MSEDTVIVIRTQAWPPRRQLTLIAITILLNVLLWSSLVCFTATLYQVASDNDDMSNIPSELLTATSSLTTVAYILLHTIFSLKQRTWKHQWRHPSIKKTSYIAIRFAVSLCVLWLLTSGWNMVIIARRPVCLAEGPSLRGWEAGPTCYVNRVGIAFSTVALVASCTLFWMLSVVRRPFEAHLLKHGFQPPSNPNLNPVDSRRPSPSRSVSLVSEKYCAGRVSASTHRSPLLNASNPDVDTMDLNSSSRPLTIHAPSPIRSIGLGIFTSNAHPPLLPPAFATHFHSRPSSQHMECPPIFHPSASNQHLPLPPRMSVLIPSSGFVPLSVPPQFSASAWRAVHPPALFPLSQAASRSHPQLPSTNNLDYAHRNHFSRSCVSLTRPHPLSRTGVTPAWGPRSGSRGLDNGARSPSSGGKSAIGSRSWIGHGKGTPNDIAYASANGTPTPRPELEKANMEGKETSVGHVHRASVPNAAVDAQLCVRKRECRKPQFKDLFEGSEPETQLHMISRPASIIPSSSAVDLLSMSSRFSSDTSPDDDELDLRFEIEKELDLRTLKDIEQSIAVWKIRSEDPIRFFNLEAKTNNTVAGARRDR